MSSRLMTSFGFGAVEDKALGGTSTSSVTGIEVGEGLVFFLGGLLPETLLDNKRIRHLAYLSLSCAKKVSRKSSSYAGLLKNSSRLAYELLLVSISLRPCFSFSAFLVAASLGVSHECLGTAPEAVPLFRLAGEGPSGISVSDAASGLVVPVCEIRVRVPRSFSSRVSS
jgi:hypothetical protein